MLQKFVKTGKQCTWPGCTGDAVKTKLPVAGKTIHCIKHQMRKHSGRVGPNWLRDNYRENLKSYCEMSGRRWCDMYEEVKAGFKVLGQEFTRVDLGAYYRFPNGLELQVNIENLNDELYFPHSHSTHQASVGEPFNARISIRKDF